MTLVQFNSKSVTQRYEIIWEWGYFIVNKRIGNINEVIYFVNGFFAEVLVRISDNKLINVAGVSIDDLPPRYFELANNLNLSVALPPGETMFSLDPENAK